MENTSIQVSGNEIANILNEVRVSPEEARKWLEQNVQPYKELMEYYRCAIMEIETKFNVLNEELSLKYDRNPIETIKSRLKSPESIAEKMRRKNIFPTVSMKSLLLWTEENNEKSQYCQRNTSCHFKSQKQNQSCCRSMRR